MLRVIRPMLTAMCAAALLTGCGDDDDAASKAPATAVNANDLAESVQQAALPIMKASLAEANKSLTANGLDALPTDGEIVATCQGEAAARTCKTSFGDRDRTTDAEWKIQVREGGCWSGRLHATAVSEGIAGRQGAMQPVSPAERRPIKGCARVDAF